MTTSREPSSPIEFGLPNLDTLEAISRGEQASPEAVGASDVGTAARIDWQAAGVAPPSRVPSGRRPC